MTIEVVTLGTGSPIPDPDRAGPSTLVRAGGEHLLFDAGRAVLMRLVAAGVLPGMVTEVLLTHLHSDHLTDLNDLVTTRWVMSPVRSPLRITGPPGTRGMVDGLLAMLAPDIGYRLAHHDDLNDRPDPVVAEISPGPVFDRDGVTLTAAASDHRPVEPSLAYRVDHDGRSVVIGGDGVPCAALDELCAGADVYVQTVIRDDLVRLVPMARLQDILDYHSTVAQAADTAARAGVGTLVLTHRVPTPAPGSDDEWRAQAASHFDGEVVLADDLTTVAIG